jgi:hypothetical protein
MDPPASPPLTVARNHRWGGVPFMAALDGQADKGLVLRSAGEQGPIAEAAARREASAGRFRALQAPVTGRADAAVASFGAA